jgi:DNA-binding NarL/FixJ family response regulator
MPLRILIADDSEPVRRGIVNLLAPTAHWEVCGEAKDGAEAIQMATNLLPDLVLLDMSMPGVSGLDAARAIRQKLPTVKILIMSQHDPAVLATRAREAGAQECIDKSRLSTDLVPAIKHVEANPKINELS